MSHGNPDPQERSQIEIGTRSNVSSFEVKHLGTMRDRIGNSELKKPFSPAYCLLLQSFLPNVI